MLEKRINGQIVLEEVLANHLVKAGSGFFSFSAVGWDQFFIGERLFEKVGGKRVFLFRHSMIRWDWFGSFVPHRILFHIVYLFVKGSFNFTFLLSISLSILIFPLLFNICLLYLFWIILSSHLLNYVFLYNFYLYKLYTPRWPYPHVQFSLNSSV